MDVSKEAPIEIRRANVDDISHLLPLIGAYWGFEGIHGYDPQPVASQLARLLSDSKLGAGWIAIQAQRVVGYLLAVYVFSLEHLGLTAEIDELFLVPSCRANGVGSQLLQVAELEFARSGCTNVSLQLARENSTARAFYHRRGYVERRGYELLEKSLTG